MNESSESDPDPHSNTGLVIFYYVNTSVSVVLNSVVLLVLSRQQTLPEVARLLHQLHACLDLAQALAMGAWSITWYSGDVTVCRVSNDFLPFLSHALLFTNMGSISWLCINKYLLISRPLRYAVQLSMKRIRFWLFVTCVSLSATCLIHLPFPGLPFVDKYIADCTGIQPEPGFSPWVGVFDACFISIPIAFACIATTCTNIGLVRIVVKQSRAIAQLREAGSRMAPAQTTVAMTRPRQNSQSKAAVVAQSCIRFKGVATVVLLQASFYFCWIPGVLYFAMADQALRSAFDALSALSTTIQPLAYLLSTKEARRMIIKGVASKDNVYIT